MWSSPSARRAQELAAGHVVCIFAEGAISRTGNLLPFKRGMEKIVDGLDVPDHPGASRPPVGQHLQLRARPVLLEVAEAHSVSGDGLVRRSRCPSTATAHEVRQAIQELGSEAVAHRKTARRHAAARFIRSARRNWNRFAMADSTRPRADLRPHADRQRADRRGGHAARRDEEMIGVLLPPSRGRRAGECRDHAGRDAFR